MINKIQMVEYVIRTVVAVGTLLARIIKTKIPVTGIFVLEGMV